MKPDLELIHPILEELRLLRVAIDRQTQQNAEQIEVWKAARAEDLKRWDHLEAENARVSQFHMNRVEEMRNKEVHISVRRDFIIQALSNSGEGEPRADTTLPLRPTVAATGEDPSPTPTDESPAG